MKKVIIILIVFAYFRVSAQFTVVPTGTTKMLNTISVIGKNIFISSPQHYMVQSYDECKTITQVYQPGPYWNILLRNDTNTFYILSADLPAYETILYKTINGGQTWKIQLDSMNYYVFAPTYFDTTNIILLGLSSGGIQSKNGGRSWQSYNKPITVPLCSKTYGDSIWALGGLNGAIGGINISNNRGRTWFNYGANFGKKAEPTDVGFINKDTIIATSLIGQNQSNFGISYNGGQTWTHSTNIPSNHFLNSTCIKSSNEYYIVGASNNTLGIVWKSSDFGKSWSLFNTNIQTTLTQMAVLNDSIALLCGTNGVLLRWNYKQTIFTNINENSIHQLNINIYPNPTTDKINFSYNKYLNQNFNVTITNLLGQEVFTQNQFKLEDDFDISFLPKGIYKLKIEADIGQKVYKIIKE